MSFFIALTAVMISVACSSGFFFGFCSGQHSVKQKVNQKIEAEIITCPASITKYVATGNNMANGQAPYVGAVATSDYGIPLGSVVIINGREYGVKDRTAKWINKKHGLTFDIFSEETVAECRKHGRKKNMVTFEVKPKIKKTKKIKNTSAKK